MRAALIQFTSSDDPADNADRIVAMIEQATSGGAGFILTPEVTNCVSLDRQRQIDVLHHEASDPTLAILRETAARLGVWLSIGSLALKTNDPDGRFANRSFLIDPMGAVQARYDKIHMFDVSVSDTETYRESKGYRPGEATALCTTPFGVLGLSVCYDIRFPHLYRALAQAGADILLIPAAFSPVTGVAHWQPLLQARAIETGCYVLAAAQTGTHPSSTGKTRKTYGHSMAVSPWGAVLADAGTDPGITYIDLDRSEVAQARARIPSLTHDRPFSPPR